MSEAAYAPEKEVAISVVMELRVFVARPVIGLLRQGKKWVTACWVTLGSYGLVIKQQKKLTRCNWE